MPIWRSVDVFPNRGFADKPWLPHPDDDAFVRSARRVWSAYSEALPALELPMPTSHLRIFCPPRPPDHPFPGPHVRVRLDRLDREEFQGAGLELPPGIASLSEGARTLLALDVIDFAAMRLAQLAGWDPTRLHAARQSVIDEGFEFRWRSAWKASPDRKHKARMAYRIDEAGMGRMQVEITDGAEVRSSPTTYCPVGISHVAKSIRWHGSTAVVFPEFDGRYMRTEARLDVADFAVVDMRNAAIDETTPRPSVTGLEVETKPANRIRAGGGGLGYLAPLDLYSVLRQLVEGLRSDEWQEWWAAAGLGYLEVEYSLYEHIDAAKFLVRKTAGRVLAKMELPYPAPGADVAAIGHDAVTTLLAKVQARAGLPAHPTLDHVQVDWAFVEAEQRHRDDSERFITAMMRPPEES